MIKFITILSLLSLSLTSCAQGFKKYSFQEIGLHLKVPDNYVIKDDFPNHSFLDANGNTITDSAKLRELEADLSKGLLVMSTQDGNNTASFNLAMQTEKTGNFEQYYNFSKEMQQFMARQQMTSYDTASSVFTGDNMKIYKSMTHTTKTNPVQYSGIYIAQIKKFFLVIKSDYIDNKFGEEVEKAILTAKFD